MCIAAAIGAAAVVGAGATVYAGSEAKSAAERGQNIAQGENNYINQMESPYVKSGDEAESQLNYLMGIGPKTGGTGTYGSLNQPFNVSDWKSLSPAYGFQLQQGKQGVLNTASSNEGGLSGAAQSALMDQNQAIASTSFDNAFNMYQTQNQNIYNRLAGIATIGQNAAGNNATSGANLAGTAANASIAGGNAFANGISSAGSSLANAGALYASYGAGGASDPNYYNEAAGGSGALYDAANNVIGAQ